MNNIFIGCFPACLTDKESLEKELDSLKNQIKSKAFTPIVLTKMQERLDEIINVLENNEYIDKNIIKVIQFSKTKTIGKENRPKNLEPILMYFDTGNYVNYNKDNENEAISYSEFNELLITILYSKDLNKYFLIKHKGMVREPSGILDFLNFKDVFSVKESHIEIPIIIELL